MGVAIVGNTKRISESIMKYCSKCGSEVNDEAVVCAKCGCQINQTSTTNAIDKSSGGLGFLSFLIPLLGLILYLVWKDGTPLKAKSCGIGALIGLIVQVVSYMLFMM